MCGIAGLIGSKNPLAIVGMVKAMEHRGPDDYGTWQGDGIQLGMARLSIQDLSMAGHQPMFSSDKRYAIVFNGEVYNYKELKSNFFGGEDFASGTDTEVILKMYIKFGADCLTHLRGMFAFLIWDTATNELFGARDRMGIKPLLYYQDNDKLVFSSEIKSLIASGYVPFDIDDQAVVDLFLYGSAQQNKSFIRGVLAVPPASYFKIKVGNNNHTLNFIKYWDFPTDTDDSISFEDAISKFKEIYSESVALRMISDRKVGIFLSSGLDSVSLLANLRNQNISNVRTFTIGFNDKHKKFYSEVEQAKKLSHHFGYENDSVNIGFEDVKPHWDNFIYGLDQPSIDGLNTYLVSKYSKEFLTVSLSGLGGDELMLGYPRNVNLYNLLSNRTKPFSAISDWFLKNKAFNGSLNNRYFNKIYQMAGGSKDIKLNYWFGKLQNTPEQLKKIMNKNNHSLLNKGLIDKFFQFDDNYQSNLMNKISYFEMRSYMLSQLLRDMDTLSMSQSIEVRFPLIDHKLVEFLFTLPANYKYNKKASYTKFSTGKITYQQSGIKHILAEAYKNDLPPNFLSSTKQGFQLPVNEWASKIISNDFGDIISDTFLGKYFENEYLQNIINNFNKTKILDINSYLMVVFCMWHKQMKEISTKASKTLNVN